jgi:hypothetical protein
VQITRQQADELLESLAEFHPIPRAGLDLASTIAANAQRAQIEAEKRFSVSLTKDVSGVKALRDLLSELRTAMLPSRFARFFGAKIPFPPSVLIANVLGALLGEALRLRVGGEWAISRLQPTNLGCALPGQRQLLPSHLQSWKAVHERRRGRRLVLLWRDGNQIGSDGGQSAPLNQL